MLGEIFARVDWHAWHGSNVFFQIATSMHRRHQRAHAELDVDCAEFAARDAAPQHRPMHAEAAVITSSR